MLDKHWLFFKDLIHECVNFRSETFWFRSDLFYESIRVEDGVMTLKTHSQEQANAHSLTQKTGSNLHCLYLDLLLTRLSGFKDA